MKNKKILQKIFAVLVIASILFSLFVFVCSADEGQIGNGSFDLSGDTIYTNGSLDHGIPFDVTFYSMAYGNSSSVDVSIADMSNNYTLNNFGVTFPPSAIGISPYLSDQYPRIENIPFPSFVYPFSRARSPYVYSWYESFSVSSPSVWYDDNISYTYSALMINPSLAYGLSIYNVDNLSSAFDLSVDEYNGDSLLNESMACSSVEFSYSSGELSVDKLVTTVDDCYPYFVDSLSVINLMPVDSSSVTVPYRVYLSGYKFSQGAKENISLEFLSSSNEFELDEYFSVNTYPIGDTDYNSFDSRYLATYFDTVYGLECYTSYCYLGDLLSYLVSVDGLNGMQVIESIYVTFGTSYFTNNSKINEYYNTYHNYPKIGASVRYYDVSPYTQRTHDISVDNILKSGYGGISTADDFNLLWLGTTLSQVFDTNLFGSFGLGDILFVFIGIGVFVAFLKIFAGG